MKQFIEKYQQQIRGVVSENCPTQDEHETSEWGGAVSNAR